jgi:hypothetical protein
LVLEPKEFLRLPQLLEVTGNSVKHTANQIVGNKAAENVLSTSASLADDLSAGNRDFALESAGNVFAVELLVAGDDDSLDRPVVIPVSTLSRIGGVLLENAIVEVYFARAAFDDDVAAIAWGWS